MQNGHVESFHGRLRDECLNASWLRTINDVRCTLAAWREEYNWERPHISLDYRTPYEFKLALEETRAMARVSSPTTTSNTTEKTPLRMVEKKGAGHLRTRAFNIKRVLTLSDDILMRFGINDP